uniref:Connector enhancer of kinase suppressor of Ras 1 n=1 Tax=Strix occidentalis caurina TaxID=311401 RepID=A0A8D0F8V4_STROC
MEPVGTWGPTQAAAWLRGLDAAVQGYPFEAWGLAGPDLLGLSVAALEALGVWRLGHQELLLEAVEQLRALVSASTHGWALLLAQQVRGGWGHPWVLGAPRTWLRSLLCVVCPPPRYLFSTLNDFSASRDIILLCLCVLSPQDCPAAERDTQILRICQHIVGICESIVGCSPPALLDRRAVLQRVGLALPPGPCGSPPTSPDTPTLPLTWGRGHVPQLTRGWVQVGWTRNNLVKKLLEKASRVTLVLKKIPLDLAGSPPSPRQQVAIPELPVHPQCHTGLCWELGRDAQSQASPTTLVVPKALGGPWWGTDWLSPACSPFPTLDVEPPTPPTMLWPAGVATRLSRRRVSCRDLGRVDCDGWLLKKKDHVGFMAQKWKRCWFVLKGHTLYWYHHPNDEKAAGLINVATYDLESTREQKKKYVFQLSHQKYKPFVFAAETLADLSMWVSHLITAKTKYTLAHQLVPDREEDCYSETEAEDPDDESPRHGCDSVSGRRGHPGEGMEDPCLTSPHLSPSQRRSLPPSPHPDPTGEDLECLMRCLKQGGVSLIGRQRFLTQEQCRKSFIRRNKNPRINEKVHVVRALQSTLKAKLVELQALEQLLNDAALTSEKFRRWKEEHQELYQDLREWGGWQQGQDGDGGLRDEHGPPEEQLLLHPPSLG